jgi:hypothetical protein
VLSLAPTFFSLEDGFDPTTTLVQGSRTTTVDVKGLLKRQLILLNGQWYTVRDAIDQVAHIEGAVHRGQPKTSKQQALAATGIGIAGYDSAVLHSLLAVARVVARGLEPLEGEIRAKRSGGQPADQ